MEYEYPYNGCGSNKEKRPPLKRGQLKVQIAKTLVGGLVVPAGATSRSNWGLPFLNPDLFVHLSSTQLISQLLI
ncbi:unnamed protein product [Miscanthus lutarioriparius]|uniref:Uncharacterized protein n=1 Tax=Miscanthus lutarioriparius TaxID=422564 RepID=A0A811NW84_9POAL|nr:unnamed protein product [Miscanthus lutarioriparius]